MNINIVKVGFLETNCYLLEKDNHILIIDPGDEFEKINVYLKDKIIDGVIITHYHFDHIGALNDIINNYKVNIYDYKSLKEGNNKVGIFDFEMIKTPGHKEDLISIYFKEYSSLFCGDFIFKGSIERTDLLGGDYNIMIESIKKILKYPVDTIIYPGHGPNTTLKDEKYNLMCIIENEY